MAPTLANGKSTETKDTQPFETQPEKSKNLCNAGVMQVLLGCFPMEPKCKELKSPEHNTEATGTDQNPRCGAQALSINKPLSV